MHAATLVLLCLPLVCVVLAALQDKRTNRLAPHWSKDQTIAARDETKKGTASYYTEWQHNPGSCGYIPTATHIVALAPTFMPQSCGMCIMVHYRGKKIQALVTDTCPSCEKRKIDISNVLFSHLDSLDRGIIDVEWNFVPC